MYTSSLCLDMAHHNRPYQTVQRRLTSGHEDASEQNTTLTSKLILGCGGCQIKSKHLIRVTSQTQTKFHANYALAWSTCDMHKQQSWISCSFLQARQTNNDVHYLEKRNWRLWTQLKQSCERLQESWIGPTNGEAQLKRAKRECNAYDSPVNI